MRTVTNATTSHPRQIAHHAAVTESFPPDESTATHGLTREGFENHAAEHPNRFLRRRTDSHATQRPRV